MTFSYFTQFRQNSQVTLIMNISRSTGIHVMYPKDHRRSFSSRPGAVVMRPG